jgi:hypothetical protein
MYRKQTRNLTESLTKNPTEWDPPAPATVYIKIKDIPYETFKTRLNQGFVTTELDQIRYRLEGTSTAVESVLSTLTDIASLRTEKLNQNGFASHLSQKRNLYTSMPGLARKAPQVSGTFLI